MSILQDIYYHEYFPSEPLDEMPFDLCQKQQEFYNEVEKAMGEEFIAKLWDNLGDVQAFRDYINFREGFRLGIPLMMERR